MATLILKSLLAGYILVAVGMLIFIAGDAPFYSMFILPIFFWPATLIVSGLALLVFRAIDEHR